MMFSSVYKQASCSLQDWLVLFFQITPDYKKFYLLGLKTLISFLVHGLIITAVGFWLLVPVFKACEQFRKTFSPPKNVSGFVSVKHTALLLPYIFGMFSLFPVAVLSLANFTAIDFQSYPSHPHACLHQAGNWLKKSQTWFKK